MTADFLSPCIVCSLIINKVCVRRDGGVGREWGGGGGGLRIAFARRSVATLSTLLKMQLDARNPRDGCCRI